MPNSTELPKKSCGEPNRCHQRAPAAGRGLQLSDTRGKFQKALRAGRRDRCEHIVAVQRGWVQIAARVCGLSHG